MVKQMTYANVADPTQEGLRKWEEASGEDAAAKDILAKLHLVSISLTRGGMRTTTWQKREAVPRRARI